MAIAQILLDGGAQVNLPCRDGGTPLIYASLRGHLDICVMLLDRGTEVDMQDNDGGTALMLAVEWNTIDAVQVLMERKALLLSDDAALAEYVTKFSFHLPISILVKQERNWRRRKPWFLFWLALRRFVVAVRFGTRARKKEGHLARTVLSVDLIDRKVASYL